MDVANVENAGAFFHKRKYPKKRRPGCRLFLVFLVFDGGCRKGLLSLRKRAASAIVPALLYLLHSCSRPCRAPNGLILLKAQVLGAANGITLPPNKQCCLCVTFATRLVLGIIAF